LPDTLLWPPWGPEQINPNPTTFQSDDSNRKCEKLWTLPGVLWKTQCNNVRNTEQNEQIESAQTKSPTSMRIFFDIVDFLLSYSLVMMRQNWSGVNFRTK
jgi:hypothetical protein